MTFFITSGVMLAFFALMYLAADRRGSREAGTPQKGVAVARPGPEDSKTVFLRLGPEDSPLLCLLKFNAIENRIGIICFSPSFCPDPVGDSLGETLQKTGPRGCRQSLGENFKVKIDSYLRCSFRQAGYMTAGLSPVSLEEMENRLPSAFRNFVLKRTRALDGRTFARAADKAPFIFDTGPGLAFAGEYICGIIRTNLEILPSVAGGRLKKDYSSFDTDLNSRSMAAFDRIINFLSSAHVTYDRQIVLSGDDGESARQKIRRVTQ